MPRSIGKPPGGSNRPPGGRGAGGRRPGSSGRPGWGWKKFEELSIRRGLVRRLVETPNRRTPMKYLSFIRTAEKFRAVQPPAAMMDAMGKLIERSMKEGWLVDTGGLAPSRDGFRMRLSGGKLTTIDGPFSESKEVIGGWAILEAGSKEEALRFTTEFLDLHRQHWPAFEGECEVRPIEFQAVG
jgi:hypothetical protein